MCCISVNMHIDHLFGSERTAEETTAVSTVEAQGKAGNGKQLHAHCAWRCSRPICARPAGRTTTKGTGLAVKGSETTSERQWCLRKHKRKAVVWLRAHLAESAARVPDLSEGLAQPGLDFDLLDHLNR